MTPGARLLLDLPRRACVWPIGDIEDAAFRWCSASCAPGSAYCSKHREASIGTGEDTAAPDDVVDDAGAHYRIERRAGRGMGDRRQFRVVPAGVQKPASRSPVGVKDEPAAHVPLDHEDSRQHAAHGFPDAE